MKRKDKMKRKKVEREKEKLIRQKDSSFILHPSFFSWRTL
jgi:hypothetical protein